MSLRKILKQVKSSNDLIYLALISLYSNINEDTSKLGTRKYILPEIVYLLDEKSLINLITYYGGESITIPKPSVLKDQIYGILAYYYSEIEGIKDWKTIISKMDLPYSEELVLKLKDLMNKVLTNTSNIKLLKSIPNEKKL